MAVSAEYQALSSEQKLLLSQQTPPRVGEGQAEWYARATASIPTRGPFIPTQPAQRPGTVQATMAPVQATPAVGVAALPAALAAILPAGAVAAAGTIYGLAQMAGVQFPWETGPGEGFISPLTRDIKQDESGRWVTRETRPDLWNGGAVMAPTVMNGQAFAQLGTYGPTVVKTWTANGWPFAMTSDGRIHTVTKTGIRKSWKPYKSVVLGKKINSSMAKRAVRKLQGIVKLGKDIEKLGGTRVVYRKK